MRFALSGQNMLDSAYFCQKNDFNGNWEEKPMSNMCTSMEQLIGRTPLPEWTSRERQYALRTRLLAKPEYFNPACSGKDRIEEAMPGAAGASSAPRPDSTIIQPTSGNMRVALRCVPPRAAIGRLS